MNRIVGSVINPNPEIYKDAGEVKTNFVAFGRNRKVASGEKRLVMKKKKCVMFIDGKRVVLTADQIAGGISRCPPKEGDVIPVKVVDP